MSKIQVLVCTPVSGKNDRGSYSFFRLASVFVDDAGHPQAVGDIVSDHEVVPGVYPASFVVSSYQGKLTAKLVPVVGSPASAGASK